MHISIDGLQLKKWDARGAVDLWWLVSGHLQWPIKIMKILLLIIISLPFDGNKESYHIYWPNNYVVLDQFFKYASLDNVFQEIQVIREL